VIVINRSVDNPARARPRVRTILAHTVADLRPYVWGRGDISEAALLALPVLRPGTNLLVLLGRARMDSCQVIRRALDDPHLRWHYANRITLIGQDPEFVAEMRDVAS
jgi:hypothetical protein